LLLFVAFCSYTRQKSITFERSFTKRGNTAARARYINEKHKYDDDSFSSVFLAVLSLFRFWGGSFSFASANTNSGKESDNKYLSELRSKLQIEPITPHIDALSKFSSSEDELKGVTRLVYSKEDLEARAYVKNLMKKNGLKVREDAMGSIFGRWKGLKNRRKEAATWSGLGRTRTRFL
jgi:hypothetical protein